MLAQWASLNPQGSKAPNGLVTRLALECTGHPTGATCQGSSLMTYPSLNGTFPQIMSNDWYQLGSYRVVSLWGNLPHFCQCIDQGTEKSCRIFRGVFISSFCSSKMFYVEQLLQLSANSAAPLPTGRQTFRGAHSVMALSAWRKSKARDEAKALYVETGRWKKLVQCCTVVTRLYKLACPRVLPHAASTA